VEASGAGQPHDWVSEMRRIHHTGIIVSDLERSIAFYHDLLGLPLASEPSPVVAEPRLGPALGVPGASLRMVTFDVGGDTLELLEYLTPPSPIEAPMPQNALGAHHVAFLVDDIAAKVEQLEAEGVTFLSPVNRVDEGVLAGWRWVYFTDPDGITLELVEIAYARFEERRENVAYYLAERTAKPTEHLEH
jgi:catechol 2,3-dioxygenase-like lactoylglutathione lyase family enzyme